MPKVADLVGARFGQLVVLAFAGIAKDRKSTWLCRCDCGVQGVKPRQSLVAGSTRSCGCGIWNKGNPTHGLSKTRTYRSWRGMRARCSNPNTACYRYYGARGIRVSPKWDQFEAFLEDMGECPPGLTLERIDNDGHYEPGNCRWATRAEQTRNRSDSRRLEIGGESLVLSDWAARLGISRESLRDRLDKHGWSVERALTTPALAAGRPRGSLKAKAA